jgi:kynurenine formamidase
MHVVGRFRASHFGMSSTASAVDFSENITIMRFVDLSHPLENGQRSFSPEDLPIQIVAHNGTASVGYNITEIHMTTHQGTHIDAPYHLFDEGTTIDQIPLDRLGGPAVLVDFAPGGILPAHTPITPEMLQPHAEKFQPGAKVICRTGWHQRFNTREFFTIPPSFSLEATRWIASRRIALFGMDTPSPNMDWKAVHQVLLAKDREIVIIESMANLDQIPERFTLAAFPLRIQGRDGSPVRAVAMIDE